MKVLSLIVASMLVLSVSSMAIEQPQTELDLIQPRIFGMAKDFVNLIIVEPVNELASSLAGMVSHVTAGVALNGIKPLIGKRDVEMEEGILNLYNQIIKNFKNKVDQGFQKLISKWTKELNKDEVEMRGLSSALSNAANNFKNTVVTVVDNTVKDVALAITIGLSNFAQGKREIELDEVQMRGLWSSLTDLGTSVVGTVTTTVVSAGKELANNVKDAVDTAVKDAALAITQGLSNFAQGKREIELDEAQMRGLWSSITDLGTSVVGTVTTTVVSAGKELATNVKDAVDTAVKDTALIITSGLSNFAQGKRELDEVEMRGLISALVNTVDNATKVVALQTTKVLAHIAENGLLPTIGKRSSDMQTVDALVHDLLTMISQHSNIQVSGGNGSNLIGK